MRTVEAVSETNVVFTKKAERFRGIKLQPVRVAGSVFEVAETLAEELPAQRIARGQAVRVERRCSARQPLYTIGHAVHIGRCRRVIQVVVAPGPGCIDQPGRSERTVVTCDE